MNFPFRYAGEMVFYRPEQFDRVRLVEQLSKEYPVTTKDQGIIHLTMSSPFFGFPVQAFVSVLEENSTIRVMYSISLIDTNMLFFLSAAFSVFFYLIRYPALSVFFGFLGVVYYGASVSKTSSKLKSDLKKAFGDITEPGEAELWQQQQEWMKNSEVCPACGEPINPYAATCINCGLQLNKQKKHNPVTRESLTDPITVHYTMKKGKE